MLLARLTPRLGRTAALITMAAAIGCSAPAPGAIHYGVDACDHCRMTIADARFAGQIVMRTAKVYRFDDPRCLANFVNAGREPSAEVHSIWLNDYAAPDRLVPADQAVFTASDRIRAPMNGGAAAFASRTEAETLQRTVGGRLQSWGEFLEGGS